MLNDQTFEFGQARLKLKDSLRFTMRRSGGGVEYLVEDELTGRFFRVGVAQYAFMSMLDGVRTVSTALMKTATLMPEHAIDENDAANLCKWAIESGLVESETGNSAARRLEQHENQQKQKVVSYLNPMMLRIPLFNPDPIVAKMTQFLGFLVSPLGFLVWFTVVVYGFLKLAGHWNDFFAHRVNSFGANDFVWLAITWMILKVVHECAHSLVCRKYGGRVHSCGVLLLLFIPLPFVDVTSSWRFAGKWKRILTSAAGMMSEIFIAAIACCIWVASDPGPLKYHAGNVIISATLHTLLFNINPLMRFDGYYMLADFLEIPNLSTHGRQWLKGTFKRMYFGAPQSKLTETGLRGLAVRVYGVLAMGWFFMIGIGLTLAASSFIEGFGLIIAMLGMVLWVGIPLFMLGKYLCVGSKIETPNRLYFTGAMTLTLILVGGFLYLCPSPSVVSAPLVIEYEPLSVVRTNARGFVDQIHVEDGSMVREGDLLLTLNNPELQQEFNSLLIDIRISELRSNTLFSRNEIARYQLEQESLEAMVKRKVELEKEIANLDVYALADGRVLARDLDSFEGRFCDRGTELLSIGKPGELQAIAMTRQSDIQWMESAGKEGLEMFIWGRHQNELVNGKIKRINPRARDDLPHEAFAASVGGPLAVVPREQSEGEGGGEDQQLMLVQPRVPIEIELEESVRAELVAGQTGQLIIRGRDENMGSYLVANLIRFVRKNNFRTHGL